MLAAVNIVEEGDITISSFVKDLGLALAPNMCPDQSKVFQEVNIKPSVTPWCVL